MSTYAKEQLIEQAKKNIEVLRGAVEKIPGASDAAVIHLKLAEITLASLEAEPVGFIHPFTPFTFGKSSGAIFKEETRHYYKPVYASPPAPVSVPDLTALDNLAGEMLNHAMNCERRVAVAYTHCAHRLAEEVRDLRAAMIHGADGALTDEDTKRVDELVMWIKRLAHSLRKSNPDSKLQSDAMDYLSRKGLISVKDILR